MHSSVHCSTIYNSQDMEDNSMSTGTWMAKEDVVHICTMECYSFMIKNEIMPFEAMGMGLEIVVLSEVRQRKTYIIWHH